MNRKQLNQHPGRHLSVFATVLSLAGVLLVTACSQAPAWSQIPSITRLSPRSTIVVADAVRQQAGTDGPTSSGSRRMYIAGLSQSNGVWAALCPVSLKLSRVTIQNSVVVGDAYGSAHAFPVGTDVSQLALDGAGHIHMVQGRPTRILQARAVSVVDLEGNQLTSYSLPAIRASALPFLNGSDLIWKMSKTLVKQQTVSPLTSESNVNESGQYQYIGPLKDGGYFVYGVVSEVITLHRADGSVRGSVSAPLDAAYQVVGTPVPKRPQPSDIIRTVWAASDSTGLLYICLSGMKNDAARIAVIGAESGSLLRVIEAALPAFPADTTAANSAGIMFPGFGAVDDQLVIADTQKAVVAIYSIR